MILVVQQHLDWWHHNSQHAVNWIYDIHLVCPLSGSGSVPATNKPQGEIESVYHPHLTGENVKPNSIQKVMKNEFVFPYTSA